MRLGFRSALAALALAVSPIALAGCAGFPSTVEEVTPKSPREAYAEANIALIGAATTVQFLHDQGYISTERATEYRDSLAKASNDLTIARQLMSAGSIESALARVIIAQGVLDSLALELSEIADNG